MYLDPGRYAETPSYDLLAAASRGLIGLDQRLFHALLDEPFRTLDGIVRFAAAFDENTPVNLEMDLIAIFRQLRASEGLPFLTTLARSYASDLPDDLCDTFRAIGAPAIDPLLEVVSETDASERGDVVFLLGTLGVRDPRILLLVTEHLSIDPFEASLALAHYGDRAALPALEARLALFAEPPGATERFARNEVQSAIDTLKEEPAPTAADATFDIFSIYPREAEPAFEVLTEAGCLVFLNCPRPEYRAAAIAEMGTRETVRHLADRLFAPATSDTDAVVRGRAWEVLNEVVENRPDIRKAMLDRLRDASVPPAERAGALLGLCSEAGGALREYTIGLYALAETRASALRAMWRSFDRDFADYFRRHIDEGDLEVRRQAISGAGYLGLYSEASRIQKYFDDDDLRDDALFAYSLAVPAEISRGRIRALFRRIDATAGPLSLEEKELVETALDQRLAMHGLDPVFAESEWGSENEEGQPVKAPVKVGRNDPCPCGSGKKYKKCCGA